MTYLNGYLAGLDDRIDLNTPDKPLANLAAIADRVEAGRIELPPRWEFERTPHGTQVWSPPSGRRFECDGEGRLIRELPPR